jgi:hypothetical protein
MTEHYSMVVVAWMFFILIGAWVLVNALIDIGARRFRRWVVTRWEHTPHAFRLSHRDRGGAREFGIRD